jgi:epoxyqueuosine reductase
MSLSEAIKKEARALGFDAVGISRIVESHLPSAMSSQPIPLSAPSPPSRGEGWGEGASRLLYRRLLEWLQRGYHGAMAWMAREPARRAEPRQVLPGCRSIISVGMNYYTGHRADERPGYGRIARYAWGPDYHQVMGHRLAQLEERIKDLAPEARTLSYVDTGPVMEKAWAERAGLGWVGKHSNLVSTEFGSWLLLGEILTTLELDPDEPGTDLCGSCSLCIRACPTGAIVEPYVLDARRCISYLTIELRDMAEAITPDLARAMGNRIFGCDDCLDVCPYNVHAKETIEHAFHPTSMTLAPRLDELAGMTASEFASIFAKSPIKRAKHGGFLRNVAIAQRNEQQAVVASVTRPTA